jgi:hypothetical protein
MLPGKQLTFCTQVSAMFGCDWMVWIVKWQLILAEGACQSTMISNITEVHHD